MASEQLVLLVEFVGLAGAAAAAIVVHRRHSTKDARAIHHHFNPMQDHLAQLYLILYLIVVVGDALQVKSLPALYASYGYSAGEIRTFDIVALTATAIPGVVLAAFADTLGRRKAMQAFAILYLASTALTTDASMSSLVASRMLSGIAAALLSSVFESWFVRQHRQAGFHPDLLPLSFSTCTIWASLGLLLEQLVGYYAVDLFGQVGPVYVSALVLATGFVVVSAYCPENYGDHGAAWPLPAAVQAVAHDRRLQALGLSQALFEAAVALVGLAWPTTLGLQPVTRIWVAKYFVVCFMIGSVSFAHVTNGRVAAEVLVPYVSMGGAGVLAVAGYCSQFGVRVGALFLFQICAGLFWPSQMTLRAKYVPEKHRTTTLAVFRSPVAVVQVDWFDSGNTFWLGSAFLALACLLQQIVLTTAEAKTDIIIAVDDEQVAMA